MKKSKLLLLPAVFALVLMSAIHMPKAHAATTSLNVTISITGTCSSAVGGGSGTTYLDVPTGDNVNLIATNNDPVIPQTISGSGFATETLGLNEHVPTNNPATVSLSSVTSPVQVTFTPIPTDSIAYVSSCPVGSSPIQSVIVINPAAATLTCALQDTMWLLSGSFSGTSTGTGVYKGSTQMGASITGPGAFSQKVAASSTATTFTVLDGISFGGKGTTLASVVCPKYVAPAVVAPTTTPPAPATTDTPATTPATTGTTSNATKPKSTVIAVTTKSPTTSNTRRLEKTGTGILIVLLLAIALIATNVWTAPKKLLGRIRR